MKSLIMKYQQVLGDRHTFDKNDPSSIRAFDLRLREAIGKTEDIKVARASHNIIRSVEDGEGFCRICHRNLQVVGVGRVNDYLALRHPLCKAPICLECSKTCPDAFHKAFKEGIIKASRVYLG